VNHKVHVIQQHPLGLVVALDVGRTDPGFPESLLYLIRDGLNLSGVATRADNKIISKRPGVLVHLQNGDVFGLLGFGRLYRIE
jgi:hypothetical protein